MADLLFGRHLPILHAIATMILFEGRIALIDATMRAAPPGC